MDNSIKVSYKVVVFMFAVLAVQLFPAYVPDSIDNSRSKYFPPIRSQGSTNICGAFSSVYYMTTYMVGRMQGWDQTLDTSSAADSLRFSPAYYNYWGDGYGSYPYQYIGAMKLHGALSWKNFACVTDWSNPVNRLVWNLDPGEQRNALQYRLFTSGTLYGLNSSARAHMDLKKLLDLGYVVTFHTFGRSGWQEDTIKDDVSSTADAGYVGELIGSYAKAGNGHYMTIIGYNDHIWADINKNGIVDAGEKGAFKIANSAGTSFQNKGYIWHSYDAFFTNTQVAGWTPPFNRISCIDGGSVDWIIPRQFYKPRLIAQFRIHHPKRGHMFLQLGVSETSASRPSRLWTPYLYTFKGGNYAFDGTTTPCWGTFVLDFSDIAPDFGLNRRYYLKMITNSADTGKIEDFRLIDPINGDINIVSTNLPGNAFGNDTIYASVDYTQDGVNTKPTISAMGDVELFEGRSAGFTFTVGDNETYAGSLFVTGYTAPNSTVETWGMEFKGSSADRQCILHPRYNRVTDWSAANIQVFDRHGAVSTQSFRYRVTALPDTVELTVGAPTQNRAYSTNGTWAPGSLQAAPTGDKLFVKFTGGGDSLRLTLKGYDIDNSSEVSIRINDDFLCYLPRGLDSSLSPGFDKIIIPAGKQRQGDNYIKLQNELSGTELWGVCSLRITDVNAADYSLTVNPGSGILILPSSSPLLLDSGLAVAIGVTPPQDSLFAYWEAVSGSGYHLNDSLSNPTAVTLNSGDVVLRAVYVVKPPLVGYNQIFSNSTITENMRAQRIVMPESGVINRIVMYHGPGTAGKNLLFGIYGDVGSKPGTLLGSTPATPISTSTGWQSVSLSTPVGIDSNQVVWLAWLYETAPAIYFDADATALRAEISATWQTLGGVLPASINPASAGTAAYKYGIHAYYTPGQSSNTGLDENILDGDGLNLRFALFPNPFNPETHITFRLPRSAPVSLAIYDMRGSLVDIVATGVMSAGHHEFQWNAKDKLGRQAGSGLYLFRLKTLGCEHQIMGIILK